MGPLQLDASKRTEKSTGVPSTREIVEAGARMRAWKTKKKVASKRCGKERERDRDRDRDRERQIEIDI